MDLGDARRLAAELMARHGLQDWHFAFDNARARFGVCRPARREIGLSRRLTALSSQDEVANTILHEIAHALVGPEHGHDQVWRATALAIGCDGRRTDDLPEGAEGPWQGRCPAGHVVHQHRRPTRVRSCGRCAPDVFDPHAIFDWTFRGAPAPMLSAYSVELAQIQRHHGLPPTPETEGLQDVRPLRVGTAVVIVDDPTYAGTRGTITARNRTRYVVRTESGSLRVPFALVRPAD
jgi:predicted SprT family Zn-dependent metalloprotease